MLSTPETAPASGAAYRHDLDVLRAFAVLPVIFYHYGLSFFSGGFVGVDIFFVISGYLIPSTIFGSSRPFSFFSFMLRRLRRLAPALLFVMFVCLAVGWKLLLPADYSTLSRSVIANLTATANLHFASMVAGYFAPDSDSLLLLHTWSLSVEWQYYIAFSLLVLALKRQQKTTAWVTLVLALASLIAAVVLVKADPKDAFYAGYTRFWEFSVGSAIFFFGSRWEQAIPATWRPRASALLFAVGLALIALSVTLYSRATVFPGLSAALPCLGAAAVIFAHPSRYLPRFDGLWPVRLLAAVGLISYSLYLWHWPVHVLLETYLAPPDAWAPFLWLIKMALAVPLALLSWKFVETPLRRGQGRRHAWLSLALPVVLLFAAAQAVKLNKGIPSRLPPDIPHAKLSQFHHQNQCVQSKQPSEDPDSFLHHAQNECFFLPERPATVFVWGDSHADSWMSAILAVVDPLARYSVLEYSLAGCPPLLETDNIIPFCRTFNNAAGRYLAQAKNVEVVILSSRWSVQLTDNHMATTPNGPSPERQIEDGLRRTLTHLTALGKKVIVVSTVPEYTKDIPDRIAALRFSGRVEDRFLTTADTLARERTMDAIFARLKPDFPTAQVQFINPRDLFCGPEICLVRDGSGQILYRDSNHLSVEGSLFGKVLFEQSPFFAHP